MKMKMAVVASALLVSVQAASAQFYNRYYDPNANFYYQNSDSAAAENELRDAKALRDKARKEREETGKSDVDAHLRLQEACARAIERGVEDGVRLSYCGQSSVPSVQQQPSGPIAVDQACAHLERAQGLEDEREVHARSTASSV